MFVKKVTGHVDHLWTLSNTRSYVDYNNTRVENLIFFIPRKHTIAEPFVQMALCELANGYTIIIVNKKLNCVALLDC